MQSCSKPAVLLVARVLGLLDASTMEQRNCRAKAQAEALDSANCCAGSDKEHPHISIDGDFISYDPEGSDNGVGVWRSDQPLCSELSYFEVDIMDTGLEGNIFVGLCLAGHPADTHIGYSIGSVALNATECRLVKDGCEEGVMGIGCDDGDHIGCGIHFDLISKDKGNKSLLVPVYFTKNGKELGTQWVSTFVADGLYPAISLNSIGEEVRVVLGLRKGAPRPRGVPAEDDRMLVDVDVDSHDEDWRELNHVQLRGALLEYSGQGKSRADVGLAQARCPLDTTAHYFEVEIVDPGENCYIAVGLTKKNYPKHRHPGWNKGSIAYHADDGKIFTGSSIGDPFGPRCHKGDRMGCGIYFPSNYKDSDSDYENGDECRPHADVDLLDWSDSTGDSGDGWYNKQDYVGGMTVKVFFTRNGKIIGMRQVQIPEGGFYPSVGMLGANEKVRVDLRPLTG